MEGILPAERRAEGLRIDAEGRRAFVAYWDAGIIVLDLTAPHNPKLAGWHLPTEHDEGNAAAAAFDAETQIVLVAYPDPDPLDDERADWGITALLDADKPGEPSPLSVYALEQATPDADGRVLLDGRPSPARERK